MWRGPVWRVTAADMEHGGEAAHSRAERRPGFITIADLPDTRNQQRPVLYMAPAVPQRRVDWVCPGVGCAGAAILARTTTARAARRAANRRSR